jgi:Sulfatase-modifying factor enzyme 1
VRLMSAHVEPRVANMKWIEGSTFRMGSERFYPEERPVREVEVGAFWIDERPVTAAEFRRFVEAYVPRSDVGRLSDLDAAAREAAASLRGCGHPVRLVRSIYLPCDETCFLLVETTERDAAQRLGGRLELAVLRLAEVVTVPQT